MPYDFENGEVLLIDKPYEWTSFDVVKKLRYALKVKKIGHAGTLDPLATGLLILCTGKFTKRIDTYQAQEKEYEGQLVLGETRPSIDLETPVDTTQDIAHLDEATIRAAVGPLTGAIAQVPPIYSAVQQGGERLYEKARRGETAQIAPRLVEVSVFELTRLDLPRVDFRIVCSKGTYVRSLVRDLGQALGVGAALHQLRRTRIGDYHVDQAHTLTDFIARARAEQA